jgi:hypothetical protein
MKEKLKDSALSEGKKRSLENLRPFSSRPPTSGRKKGSISIISRVKQLLAENNGAEALALAGSLLKNYKKGNPVAIKEINGRIDGILAEKVDLTGKLIIERRIVGQSPVDNSVKKPVDK